MSDPSNILRIKDNSYSFLIEEKINGESQFNKYIIDSKAGFSPHVSFDFIEELSKQIAKDSSLQNREIFYIKLNGDVFELSKKGGKIKKAVNFLFPFVKKPVEEHQNHYELTRVHLFKRVGLTICEALKYLLEKIKAIVFVWMGRILDTLINLLDNKKINITDSYTASLSSLTLPFKNETDEQLITSQAFNDPYTELSSFAFQRLEQEFNSNDNRDVSEHYDYTFISDQSGSLRLINKNELKNTDKEGLEKARDDYYDYILNLYGRDKVEYIEHCYGIRIKEVNLTPEIVYRVNIGIGNIEIQDSERFLQTLYSLKNRLDQDSNNNQPSVNPNLSLSDFLASQKKIFNLSLFELRGLYQQVSRSSKKSEPSVKDLKVWLDEIINVNVNDPATKVLSRQQFNQIMGIYSLTEEETDRRYTGKKIDKPIASGYTIAGKMEFKPWVDQQELLQSFNLFENNPSWDNYYEKLSHIVCKKHLVRKHPIEGYRAGAIIPAPPLAIKNEETGVKSYEKRWMKVTGFVNNGKGMVTYTLEPACADDTLPAIHLCRSTASDPSAFGGTASIENDINPFNSPGYEGTLATEPYVKKFFDDRTIPVWVAYQHEFDKMISKHYSSSDAKEINKLFSYMKGSFQELLISHYEKIYPPKKTLYALIGLHDTQLIHLLTQVADSKNRMRLENIVWNYNNKAYSIEGHKHLEDARFILDLLNSTKLKEATPLFERLAQELERLVDSSEQPSIEQFLSIPLNSLKLPSKLDEQVKFVNERKILKELESRYKRMETILVDLSKKDGNADLMFSDDAADIPVIFNEWKNLTKYYAKSIGEDVESKTQQQISLTGHSLGGAISQRYLVYYLVDKHRIPLPGYNAEIHVFDDPAINAEDNRSFKDFGNKHWEILETQQSRFRIVRRQEENDFVPAGGEEHLGAAFDEKEEKQLKRWLDFDACVQAPSSEPLDPIIASSTTAHATQFETGSRRSEWIASTLDKEIDQIFKRAIKKIKKETKNLNEQDIETVRKHRIDAQLKKLRRRSQKVLQRRLGDYERTWYSPVTQGNFDWGGSPKAKHWETVKKLWKLPLRLKPASCEWLRERIGFYLRTKYFLFEQARKQEERNHEVMPNYLDSNGVFAVTDEKGVVSNI